MSSKPPILVLHATGTNRDREAAWACELAGGAPEIVHVNELIRRHRRLEDYRMLVLPGGFSYGDDLGAGKLWAVALRSRLTEDLHAFAARGRPVLGICNGFQVLVKAGLLPGIQSEQCDAPLRYEQTVTLTRNDSGQFECRWVYLLPQPGSPCVFTRGLDAPIYCPVAHGEGKFVARDAETLASVERLRLPSLRYTNDHGQTPGYPGNPNGSQADIAGLCNPQGTILGLMPHPEDHVMPGQHPRHHRGENGMSGLPLFQNGIAYAAEL